MKLRIRPFVLALCFVLTTILVGCAKPEFDVSAIFDPLAMFPAEATFAWNDGANHPPENPELQPLDYDRILKQVSNEEFGKRGYSHVVSGSPDYWLSYEVTVHRWYSAKKTQAMGTLSLNLVDAKSRNRVWLGYGRARVLVGLSEKERSDRIRVILAKMLEKFPPNQRGE